MTQRNLPQFDNLPERELDKVELDQPLNRIAEIFNIEILYDYNFLGPRYRYAIHGQLRRSSHFRTAYDALLSALSEYATASE